MKDFDRHLKEVERVLKGTPPIISKYSPENYIGGGMSSLKYFGLRSPQLDEIYARGFTFSQEDPSKIAPIWNHVWNRSSYFEAMSLALSWFYDKKRLPALPDHWPLLRQWSSRIDNWAHADTLSAIYARILEADAGLVYPTLQKWNRAREPWLNRLSIVSLLCYSSQRKKVLPPAKLLPLVENLLDHEHYYVQKGVGWTLREIGNVYPREARAFIEKHVVRIRPEAYSAAVEKWSPARKAPLQKLRKEARKGRT